MVVELVAFARVPVLVQHSSFYVYVLVLFQRVEVEAVVVVVVERLRVTIYMDLG